MNQINRIPRPPKPAPAPEVPKLLPWAPERNGEAPLRAPPPRPGFLARLARRLGLHA
jgi:hypothetical protein